MKIIPLILFLCIGCAPSADFRVNECIENTLNDNVYRILDENSSQYIVKPFYYVCSGACLATLTADTSIFTQISFSQACENALPNVIIGIKDQDRYKLVGCPKLCLSIAQGV